VNGKPKAVIEGAKPKKVETKKAKAK